MFDLIETNLRNQTLDWLLHRVYEGFGIPGNTNLE